MELISKNKQLDLSVPHAMGILNITPDSFSDGGKFNQLDQALYHAESMVNAGVSLLDIGGESTRPGAESVSCEQELERVIPIIEALRCRFDTWISIDTSKAKVMTESVNAGADLINDVCALQQPDALCAAQQTGVPICLMHMQGHPETMQNAPSYSNVLEEVTCFFEQRIQCCQNHGIDKSRLLLDPGYGFGKSLVHNYQLLAHLAHFHRFKLPLLVGMSRKSMIFNALNTSPNNSLSGSLACAAIAAMQGAQIIRVHDVRETVEVLKICLMTLEQKEINWSK